MIQAPLLPEPAPPPSKLARIFVATVALARKMGVDQRRTLANGAEFVVRVSEGWIYLTLKRPDVPLGDVEERTFIEHFSIPADAYRWPRGGQLQKLDADGGIVWWICYIWKDEL